MFFRTLEEVKEGSKRSGTEIQKIIDNYIFLETGEGNFIPLFDEKWFIDYLEEFAKIIDDNYDDLKITIACPTDIRDEKFILAIALAKLSPSDKSKYDYVKSELLKLECKYSQMDINMFLMEVDSSEDFSRYKSGAFLERYE